MPLPDYGGGSIVNLMASIVAGLGPDEGDADAPAYPPHPRVPPALIRESQHVVMLVLDGLGYDFLTRRLSGGALNVGLAGAMTSVFPSTTTTAITTYLTGEAPQQHALTGWYVWLREAGLVASPLPFRSRSGNKPLGSFGFRPAMLFDRQPVFDRIDRDCFMVQPVNLWDSAYTRAHTGSALVKPYRSLRQLFSRIKRIASGRKPSFTYAYWPDLDTLGHRRGMESDAARAHLEEIDREIGALVDAVRGRGVTLVVSADHGFVDTDGGSWVNLSDHPELGDTLAVPLCGEPRAAYCYVKPDRRGDFEAYVRERLSDKCELHASEALVSDGLFGTGRPHPRLKERIGDYCLIMKENFAIRDRLATEKGDKPMIGVHGGVSSAEMHVPLVLYPA